MTRPLLILASLSIVLLSACSTPEVARGINDPNEATNRKVHAFNKKLDQTFLRPASNGYGNAVPEPVRDGIGNFAGQPLHPRLFCERRAAGQCARRHQQLLPVRGEYRVGFGGVLDVATDMGIPKRKSNFGETLHVWGVREGPYVELPFLGPSTQRDAVGTVVDVFINPVSYAIPQPERYAMPAAQGLAGVNTRFEFGELVDSILYESADSYAQARLLYLDSRRFELTGGETLDEEFDPNANPFAEYE